MNRYTVQAPQNLPRITLLHYVQKALPLLSEQAVRAAFQRRDVKVNGVRTDGEVLVPGGAVVTVFTPYVMQIPVVFENEHLLVLDKPAGVSCDADAYGSMTIADWAKMNAGEGNAPQLCHRLDNQTEGLILFSKNEPTHQALEEMFRQGNGQKAYLCIVRGAPRPQQARCIAYLTKDARHSRVHIHSTPSGGGVLIDTEYEILQSGPLSLLRVRLHTGKTHQIRAHMAFLGHPLVGDDVYGDRALNRHLGLKRQLLLSAQLALDTRGRRPDLDGLSFESPRQKKMLDDYDRLLADFHPSDSVQG